ncbi:MAG: transcriptional repressor [Chlorobi bacterium]|nr:transcriptional repressor [Chlorobiota bacterium]
MKNSSKEILSNRGLRLTKCRVSVLDLFLSKKHALTHSEIENSLKDNFDRVTLYRTLTSFLNNSLIHQIMDRDGANKYAISIDVSNISDYFDRHVHFKCTVCGITLCLPDVPVPDVKLPNGYKEKSSLLLVEGLCQTCSILE